MMKVIFVGTLHTKENEGVEVQLEYVGEDNWTFTTETESFTITDLEKVIPFLKEMFDRE